MDFTFGYRSIDGKPEFYVEYNGMECSTTSFGGREMQFTRKGMRKPIKLHMPDLQVEWNELTRWFGDNRIKSFWWRTACFYNRNILEQAIRSTLQAGNAKSIDKFIANDRCQFLLEAPAALRQYQSTTSEYKEWQAKVKKTQQQAEKLMKEIEVEFPTIDDIRDVQMEIISSTNLTFRNLVNGIEYEMRHR